VKTHLSLFMKCLLLTLLVVSQVNASGVIEIETNRGRMEIVTMAKQLPHFGLGDWERDLEYTMGFITNYEKAPSLTAPYFAGSIKPEMLEDALNCLKMIRYLVGVPVDVSLTDALNNSAQHKAVLAASIGIIAHDLPQLPDMDDGFFALTRWDTQGLSESMALHSGEANISAQLLALIGDKGHDNIGAVGHRLQLIEPQTTEYGIGYADTSSNPDALIPGHYVVVHSRWSTANFNSFIAWPNSGHCPIQYFAQTSFPQAFHYNMSMTPWSLSLGSDYLTPNRNEIKLVLTRYRDNRSWVFDSSTPNLAELDFEVYQGRVMDHLAVSNNTIIFRPGNLTIEDEDVFAVSLMGIKAADGISTTLNYEITFFDLDKEVATR